MIDDNQKLDWFYSILVGIIITCVGYLVSFYYEKSFLSYFGIPQSVISLSITTIIHPFVYIITITASSFVFVFSFINIVFLWFYDDNIHKYISRFLIIIAPVLFVISYKFYLYNIYSIIISPSPFVILLLFFFIYFITPIFHWKDIKGYKNKLEKQYEHDSKYPGLIGLAGKKFPFVVYTFLVSVVLILMAKDLGLYNAITKDFFYVNQEVQDEVVIRIYNDKIISSKFDKNLNTIKNQFSIYKISPKKVILQKKRIGPLKVEKAITNLTKAKE